MLDLGWSELLIVAIVALIVVGPRDLPRMLRTLGQYAAKAKSVAREFQRSMDEAARQADVDELRQAKKDLEKDVSGLRESQYKMQREMSQSFMDKPKEKPATSAKSGGAGDDRGAKADNGTGADAPEKGEAPAEQPAAAEPAAPAEPAEPEDRPRKASGA